MLTRRGFSLVELLVALVLLAIVSTAVYRVLVNNQRLYVAQTQRIDLQQNIRAAETILPAEFRELDASEGDIKAMSATSLTIRAMRWLAFACSPPALGLGLNGLTLTIRGGAPGQPVFFGSRPPDINKDSVLIYYDGNGTIRADDGWALGRVTGSLGLNCPTGGTGVQLTLGGPLPLALPAPTPPALTSNFAGAITNGAPVRGFEVVTYQLYKPAGDTSWYLGLQPAGASMQPLIGPLLPNGLTFSYFDSAGTAQNNPALVSRIDIVIRARTALAVRAAGSGPMQATVDSVNISVALRNNRRW
jgi:prepilin-type N-terminal cleavage/methylation domain-containing protein